MITVSTILVIDKEGTGLHIKALIKANDTSLKELQQYLGFSTVQSIYHWMNGHSIPSVDNLVLLSHLWGISINDILCCREIKYDY